jgi:hypothetical protein
MENQPWLNIAFLIFAILFWRVLKTGGRDVADDE